MKVWYGYSYLTQKAIKKRELAIYFENDDHNPLKNEEWVRKRMRVVYTRYQTAEEAKDGETSNRTLTKFSYFIDAKPFKGDIEQVLRANSEADKNNVSEEVRLEIESALRKEFFRHFDAISEP